MARVKKPVKKFYYPALDGLRFLAFFSVFLHHILFSYINHNPAANFLLIIIKKNGWVGVDLFFVLSGFLITSLLLQERLVYGNFSLKNFWIRRALRIWPLYFLALIVGFYLTPIFFAHFFNYSYTDPKFASNLSTQPIWYFAFLGNWATVIFGYSAFFNISHLWTISIEEQFYLLWPALMKLTRSINHMLILGIGLIILAILTRFILAINQVGHPGIYVNTLARLDSLTLGSIAAIIWVNKPYLLSRFKPIFKPPFQFIAFIILLLLLYRISVFDNSIARNVIFGYTVIALFMVYFLLGSLLSQSTFTNFLSVKPLVWLGKISYGLYVWHLLAIELVSHFLSSPNLILIKVVSSLLLTILLASLSYYLFEHHFLKLKMQFQPIKSRPI